MNDNVVSLSAEREARQPHWQGRVQCVGCGHQWEGVGPIGTRWVDCPKCSLPKGTPRHPFGPLPGDQVLVCAGCDSDVLFAYRRDGEATRVRCCGCGQELTDAFYNG